MDSQFGNNLHGAPSPPATRRADLKSRRPAEMTVIGILMMLFGLNGLFPAIIQVYASGDLGEISIKPPITFGLFIVSLALLVTGNALWEVRPWSRQIAVISLITSYLMGIIAGISGLLDMIYGDGDPEGKAFVGIFYVAFGGFIALIGLGILITIIVFLYRPAVTAILKEAELSR